MRTVKMLVGSVRPFGDTSWAVSIAPDNTTWLTIYAKDTNGVRPEVGDQIEVVPPRVVGLSKIRPGELMADRLETGTKAGTVE